MAANDLDAAKAPASAAAKPRRRDRPRMPPARPTIPRASSCASAQAKPLQLDFGAVELVDLQIAYQTYGALNADRSNAILICHALTGDQHVASTNPVTGKPGWWSEMVGPGKPIDTDRYFVICSNVVGGCMGTTGPASTNPATDRVYGLDLPVITVARHGARAGDAPRSSRHRHAVLRGRWLTRRHAGAAMGGGLPGARLHAPCRSPPARATLRRTSPSTRSAARR